MRRLLAALLLLAACSNEPAPPTTTAAEQPKTPPAPSVEQARELIAKSPDFGEHQFTHAGISIPVSAAAMSEPARQTAAQLAAAGWLELDPTGDIMLTDKSRDDKRFILRPNGLLDVVPLAKKEMGTVSAVRVDPNDGQAVADFTWRWIPNDVGTALTSGIEHDRFTAPVQNSTATFIWDGTAWSLLKIDEK
jgi:hypothetical protein